MVALTDVTGGGGDGGKGGPDDGWQLLLGATINKLRQWRYGNRSWSLK